MARVAIASPFEVWSAGLEAVLRSAGETVIGRCPSIADRASLELIRRAELVVVAWQCVLRSRGVMSPRPHRRNYPGHIILVLEADDELTAKDLAGIHAEALIPSWASIDDFSQCLECVRKGSRWAHPMLKGHAPDQLRDEPSPWESLSGREHEVALLAAAGQSNKVIARALGLSDGTIKIHMHHVLSKLHLHGRRDLVQWSRRERSGLLAKTLN